MSVPNLIIVAGPPAVGKSVFSNYVSRVTGFPVLEKDAFKELLFDDIGFNSREEKVKLGIAAMHLMYSEAACLLDLGISVILDNNFENASLSGLEQLVAEHSCNPITVRFIADRRTVYSRFIARDRDPKRHRGHVLNTRYPESEPKEQYVPISFEDFEKKFSQRGVFSFTFGEKVMTVDATELSSLDPAALTEKLREYLI